MNDSINLLDMLAEIAADEPCASDALGTDDGCVDTTDDYDTTPVAPGTLLEYIR